MEKFLFSDIPIPNTNFLLKLITYSSIDDVYSLLCIPQNVLYMDVNMLSTLSQAKVFVEKYLKQYGKKEKVYWLIYEENKHTCIGLLGLSSINHKHNFADLTILVSHEFRNIGIAKLCLRFFVDFIFSITYLFRLEAQVHTQNTASCKLFESLGFHKEGLLRKNFLINGEYFDSYIYSILKF
jgi:RimJ/RimL family protein N-acetyltransferase